MQKFLFRILTLILVPCLTVEPALPLRFSGAGNRPPLQVSSNSPFAGQALTLASQAATKPSMLRRRFAALAKFLPLERPVRGFWLSAGWYVINALLPRVFAGLEPEPPGQLSASGRSLAFDPVHFDSSKALARDPVLGEVFALADVTAEVKGARLEALAGGLARVQKLAFQGNILLARSREEWIRNLQDPAKVLENDVLLSLDGQVRGFAGTIEESEVREIWLSPMAVLPNGPSGQGTFLLDTLLARWQAQGVEKAGWISDPTAVEFYLGFLADRADYSYDGDLREFAVYPQTRGKLTEVQRQDQRAFRMQCRKRREDIGGLLQGLEPRTYRLTGVQRESDWILDRRGHWSESGSGQTPGMSLVTLSRLLAYDSKGRLAREGQETIGPIVFDFPTKKSVLSPHPSVIAAPSRNQTRRMDAPHARQFLASERLLFANYIRRDYQSELPAVAFRILPPERPWILSDAGTIQIDLGQVQDLDGLRDAWRAAVRRWVFNWLNEPHLLEGLLGKSLTQTLPWGKLRKAMENAKIRRALADSPLQSSTLPKRDLIGYLVPDFLAPNARTSDLVLDVGTATGSMAYVLRALGYRRVVAIDLSTRSLELARIINERFAGSWAQNHKGGFRELDYLFKRPIQWLGGDVLQLPFAGAVFNAVYARQALSMEMPWARPAMLAAIFRSLVPGGYLSALEPSEPGRDLRPDLTYEWKWMLAEWIQAFQAAGFHVESYADFHTGFFILGQKPESIPGLKEAS